MRVNVLVSFLVSGAILFASGKVCAKELHPIDIKADTVNYYTDKNLVEAHGHVKIVYKNMTLYCDKATANTLNKEVIAQGNIRIVEEGKERTINARKIVYNMESKTAKIFSSRLEAPPFYGWVKEAQMKENVYYVHKGSLTTCDLPHPHWKLTCRRINIWPQKKIVAYNVVMWVGKIPILYFPIYVQPLKEKVPNIGILPGKDSDWGYYVLTWYRYILSDNAKGKIYLDWRENKGFGEGVDFNFKNHPLGNFDLRYYYTDEGKVEDSSGRYRADLRYQKFFDGNYNRYITAEYHKFDDDNFLKDYFYREYEKQPQPDSYLYFNNNFVNSSWEFYVNKRVNSFYTNTDFLPRITWFLYNFKLPWGLYYSWQNSVGYMDNRFQDSDYHQNSFRISTRQSLRYQKNLGPLNISPFVNFQDAYYSENREDQSVNRFFFEAGLDSSLTLYKIYTLSSDSSLRHIFQPRVSFLCRHRPTFDIDRLYLFDSVDTPRYWKGFLFTLKNLLQVDSPRKSWTFLDLDLSAGYVLDSREAGEGFNDVTVDATLKTYKFLYFRTLTTYSVEDGRLDESSNDLILKFYNNISFSIGYHYKYQTNETLVSQVSTGWFKKWKLSYYNRYDLSENNFTYHQFKISRDLHCWLMDLVISVDDERNISFFVAFKLKAFPKVGFNFETSYHGPQD